MTIMINEERNTMQTKTADCTNRIIVSYDDMNSNCKQHETIQFLHREKEGLLSIISSNQLQFELFSKNYIDQKSLIMALIDLSGNDFIMKRGVFINQESGESVEGTILHAAILSCYTSGSKDYDVVMKLLDVGGKDITLQKDSDGINSLHYLCSYSAPEAVIIKMIEVGGRELVFAKNRDGWNSLFYACCYNSSNSDIIMKLIEVGGGRDIIIEKDNDGENVLFIACENNVSTDVLEKMIAVGGKEILMQTNKYGQSPLDLDKIRAVAAEK